MSFPVEVTFRHMDTSEALQQHVEKHAGKLDRLGAEILSCNVVLESVEHRHRKGNRYNAHVHLTLPGNVLDAGRTKPDDHSHEDAYVAVRDAFDAVRRQLEDYQGKLKAARKQPAPEVPEVVEDTGEE